MIAIIVLANSTRTAIASFYAKSTKIIRNQNDTHRCIGNRPGFETVFLFFLYTQRVENYRPSLIFLGMAYYIHLQVITVTVRKNEGVIVI